MKRILVAFFLFVLVILPIKVSAAAYMGNSFCITVYDGFNNLKDEFVFARTGEDGNYEYYKKPPGNLYLNVPISTEKIAFLITKVDENDIDANTFMGSDLSDFSEKERSAISSGTNNFSKTITINSKDLTRKEFLTSCYKLSLDAKRGWLYPHNLLNNFPLLITLIIFPTIFITTVLLLRRKKSKR